MAPQYKSEKVELFFNKLGQVLSKLVASLSQKESLKRIDKRASNEMQFDPLPPPIRSPMHSPTIRPTDGLGLDRSTFGGVDRSTAVPRRMQRSASIDVRRGEEPLLRRGQHQLRHF